MSTTPYVRVPREPTDEMVRAFSHASHASDSYSPETDHWTWRGDSGNFLYDYWQMLAAAPPDTLRADLEALADSWQDFAVNSHYIKTLRGLIRKHYGA